MQPGNRARGATLSWPHLLVYPHPGWVPFHRKHDVDPLLQSRTQETSVGRCGGQDAGLRTSGGARTSRPIADVGHRVEGRAEVGGR